MPVQACQLGVRVAKFEGRSPGIVFDFAELAKKAVFLELRQKHLAMGRFVRSFPDFHLLNA